ncbi:MAG: hypothetical protein ACKOCT_20635, partial [Alphaproteobacteria bacterium]
MENPCERFADRASRSTRAGVRASLLERPRGRDVGVVARLRSSTIVPSPAALLFVFLAACGSGGADSGPSEPGGGKVLFVGPARRLAPHEEGRSALFRVTATTGGATTTTTLRTRVASDDGTSFVVEQRAEDGSESRLHARD